MPAPAEHPQHDASNERTFYTRAARSYGGALVGGSFVVSALRFEGGWARTASSKRMAEATAVCAEIERLRPVGSNRAELPTFYVDGA